MHNVFRMYENDGYSKLSSMGPMFVRLQNEFITSEIGLEKNQNMDWKFEH